MADNPATIDKAAAAQGAGVEDLDPAIGNEGNPVPPAPANEPPKEDKQEDAPTAPVEEQQEEQPTEDAELDAEVWGTTGDEVGDSALALMQNSGMTPEDAKAILYDAVQAGDPSKIDRDSLIEKVGKAKANLILAGAENFIRRSQDRVATITQEVHGAVGGKDNWTAVQAWAQANVPKAELTEYARMIDAGGAQARFAASELAGKYNGDEKNTTLNANRAVITPDNKAAPSGKATTRAEYYAALEAAHKFGTPSEETLREINAARARGRANGI